MLNVGMAELLCFSIIALLVLGPEKLPEGARFVAKWYGKGKRFIADIQNEVDRELKLSEFRDEIKQEIERMNAIEKRLQQQIHQLHTQHLPSHHSYRRYTFLESYSYLPFSISYLKQFPTSVASVSAPRLKIAV